MFLALSIDSINFGILVLGVATLATTIAIRILVSRNGRWLVRQPVRMLMIALFPPLFLVAMAGLATSYDLHTINLEQEFPWFPPGLLAFAVAILVLGAGRRYGHDPDVSKTGVSRAK